MIDTAERRADETEHAVLARHVRAVWWMPGTALGVVSCPAAVADRLFLRWNYWWQAQLLDCLVDAQLRAPNRLRLKQMNALTRGHRLRNLGMWTNGSYDDVAWLGLALLRASAAGIARPRAVLALARALMSAAEASPGAALPWRRGDTYRNVPVNAPAGLLFARLGEVSRAQEIADWIDSELVDADSGLVFDGVRDGELPNRGAVHLLPRWCARSRDGIGRAHRPSAAPGTRLPPSSGRARADGHRGSPARLRHG